MQLTSEPRFVRFLDTLKRIYVCVHFLEALREAPIYLRFLRELISKKEEPRKASALLIGEACSALLQRQSALKLHDLGSFSIPCCIRDLQIEGAIYDVGASVSLMPPSLYKKLQLLDLTPTNMSIQFIDHSIK